MPEKRRELKPPHTMTAKISPELLARLEALPDRKGGAKGFDWTPELDAILLAGWQCKLQTDMAKLIGCCEETCRKHYRELTKAAP